ncbi:MAG: hypothetical protein Q3966_04395 [Neisseria sp.]|nr:hypothetical protein [Neisseria sp.]
MLSLFVESKWEKAALLPVLKAKTRFSIDFAIDFSDPAGGAQAKAAYCLELYTILHIAGGRKNQKGRPNVSDGLF